MSSPAERSLHAIRRYQQQRLWQVAVMCTLIVLVGAWLSGPKSALVLYITAVGLMPVLYLLYRQRAEAANSWFLWMLTIAVSGLLMLNNAVFEPAIMCYPVLLVYAALFGRPGLYFKLLTFMLGFVITLCSVILAGAWPQTTPEMTWNSLAVAVLVLLASGFTVRLLASGYRKLLQSLQAENNRVKASEQKLSALAEHDSLTGLLNRHGASNHFDDCPLESRALLFIDLDQFKPINDALGHATGDAVLQYLAQQLRQALRPDEWACRFGGDEFVLVLQHDSELVGRLEQLLNLCQREIPIGAYPLKLSASIGVALAPEHGNDFTELCRKADMAMYRAKADGRNTWQFYQASLDDQQHSTLTLITLLRQALVKGQISIVYQPKFQLQPFAIKGVEALMRWHCPELGHVSPARFIPLAEETGLIDELGVFVLQHACQQMQRWHQMGWALHLAVNVSGRQLRSGLLPTQVAHTLQSSGLIAKYLQLELTESSLIGDHQHIQQQLEQVGELGVALAIDDFGTGYSNLQYLSRFQAGTLKIDQSFVRNLPHRPQDLALVRGIIRLADSLQLATVAEGVEDEASFQLLRDLGCNEAQGYFWAKPLTVAELTTALQEARWPLRESPPVVGN